MELINQYRVARMLESLKGWFGIILLVFFVLLMVCAYLTYTKVKLVQADDKKPGVRIKGKVLEKYVEEDKTNAIFLKFNIRIEWIIVECPDGKRLRLRNLPSKNDIQLMPDDQGEFMYRGETIYRFDREKV